MKSTGLVTFKIFAPSHSLRVRGLKFGILWESFIQRFVALITSAWIEILNMKIPDDFSKVALITSQWIEIPALCHIVLKFRVALFMSVLIKSAEKELFKIWKIEFLIDEGFYPVHN